MTAKQFFYVAGGVLLIAIAYGVGVHDAQADFDGSQQLVLGLESSDPDNVWILRNDGTVWASGQQRTQWYVPSCTSTLPVPIAEVALWNRGALVTRTGEVWVVNSACTWQRLAPVPEPTVGTQKTTWSDAKEGYR